MTRNYEWLLSFTKIENGGDVSFRDNSKGKILGIGNVGKVSSTLIENVYTTWLVLVNCVTRIIKLFFIKLDVLLKCVW